MRAKSAPFGHSTSKSSSGIILPGCDEGEIRSLWSLDIEIVQRNNSVRLR